LEKSDERGDMEFGKMRMKELRTKTWGKAWREGKGRCSGGDLKQKGLEKSRREDKGAHGEEFEKTVRGEGTIQQVGKSKIFVKRMTMEKARWREHSKRNRGGQEIKKLHSGEVNGARGEKEGTGTKEKKAGYSKSRDKTKKTICPLGAKKKNSCETKRGGKGDA